ncbi:hypothetical protein DL768_009202 [Monosporascus sp. mg162]|nr:hypothetical protein DL768_009202 [Monosporascus sp. mg162]
MSPAPPGLGAVPGGAKFERTGRINTGVDSVPDVVPARMEQWDQAPEGTNDFSWTFQARDGYESDEHRDGMAFLGTVQFNNWRGLAFWDHNRYEHHMSFAEEPLVNRNFAGRYMLATFSSSMRRDWWRFDHPDSPVTLNPALALTGLPTRRQLFAEATAEDIGRWEGCVSPVYEDETGDNEDEEDEEDEDGEYGDGDDDDGDDEDEDGGLELLDIGL